MRKGCSGQVHAETAVVGLGGGDVLRAIVELDDLVEVLHRGCVGTAVLVRVGRNGVVYV